MPNPFEEQANEQDRFMQARKDALAKYSNISKNRFIFVCNVWFWIPKDEAGWKKAFGMMMVMMPM